MAGGVGSTTVTLAGDEITAGQYGVRSSNGSKATDLTVNQTGGAIKGASYGIYASNAGTGTTTIIAAGNVTGTDGFGIAAYGGANTAGVTVQQRVGTIDGRTGILLSNEGMGASLVSVLGTVVGGAGAGTGRLRLIVS